MGFLAVLTLFNGLGIVTLKSPDWIVVPGWIVIAYFFVLPILPAVPGSKTYCSVLDQVVLRLCEFPLAVYQVSLRMQSPRRLYYSVLGTLVVVSAVGITYVSLKFVDFHKATAERRREVELASRDYWVRLADLVSRTPLDARVQQPVRALRQFLATLPPELAQQREHAASIATVLDCLAAANESVEAIHSTTFPAKGDQFPSWLKEHVADKLIDMRPDCQVVAQCALLAALRLYVSAAISTTADACMKKADVIIHSPDFSGALLTPDALPMEMPVDQRANIACASFNILGVYEFLCARNEYQGWINSRIGPMPVRVAQALSSARSHYQESKQLAKGDIELWRVEHNINDWELLIISIVVEGDGPALAAAAGVHVEIRTLVKNLEGEDSVPRELRARDERLRDAQRVRPTAENAVTRAQLECLTAKWWRTQGVTGAERATEALRRADSHLRWAVDAMQDGTVLLRPEHNYLGELARHPKHIDSFAELASRAMARMEESRLAYANGM